MPRPSLNTTILDLYNKQHVGGAFDAKTAGKKFVDYFPNDFADGFTRGGQNTKLPKKNSSYLNGYDGRRYK